MSVKRFALGLLGCLLAAGVQAASAAPRQQETTPEAETPFAPPVWISPTPDETGTLAVIVQPGESLWIIAARAGLTLPELLALNNLDESAIIKPGDVIIIGIVTPSAPPAPTVSPEELTPTTTRPPPTPRPTEPPAEATICLTAFEDVNGNAMQDTGEPLRAGVAFTVYNTEAVVLNYITDGVSEPRCLGGLPPGDYRVTRSVVPGETLTTPGDWALTLREGNALYQSFGSMNTGAPTAAAVLQATSTLPAGPQETAAPASLSEDSVAVGDSGIWWRVAGVAILFLGGLLLMGAVLILLLRQSRSSVQSDEPAESERRFRNLDEID